MRENKIENKVCEYAERQGFEHRKLAWVGRRGAPDRIYWKPGVLPFFIEFKRPGETPRWEQVEELESLRQAGLDTYVVDTIEDGMRIIDHHDRIL